MRKKSFHFFSSECLGQGFLVYLPRSLFLVSAIGMHPLRFSMCSLNIVKKNKEKQKKKTPHIYIPIYVYTCILCIYEMYIHKNGREFVLCSESIEAHGMNWLILDHFCLHIIEFPMCLFHNLLNFFL